MTLLHDTWLVGTGNGLYAPHAQGHWQRLGAYQFQITALHRTPRRILVATGSGLWQLDQDRWLQLHDETLTEVLDVIEHQGQFFAASAYGLALGKEVDAGRTCWHWLSDHLPVDQRFTNALAAGDGDLLVGTEGGLLIYNAAGDWRTSPIEGVAVRCLAQTHQGYYAGSDTGLWFSHDAGAWQRLAESIPVYCLAAAGPHLLAGTEDGLRLIQNGPTWQPLGLEATRITALAVDPNAGDHWLAGAAPGGLWESWDAGQSWTSVPQIRQDVTTILTPGAKRGL
ncbi:MAG: hypothetical protein GKR89_31875 [Candidatus Latescibacteria bacterium]|nr:hypothetical protein [Candidatus Latescibacterota bacterium]